MVNWRKWRFTSPCRFYPQQQTSSDRSRHVRFVPTAEIPPLPARCRQTATSSLRREAVASRRAASRFERVRLQCRAPLDDGVIEQFEHQTKGRQFLFLDGAIIVAFERFTYDGVDLALHRQQFLVGFRAAYAGNHGQDSVAMAGFFAPFIPIQIVTQPGAGRTDPGEKQERKPEVIAVPVEEGAFGAVDDSCRSPMHRQLGVFLGGRRSIVKRNWQLPGNSLTDS